MFGCPCGGGRCRRSDHGRSGGGGFGTARVADGVKWIVGIGSGGGEGWVIL